MILFMIFMDSGVNWAEIVVVWLFLRSFRVIFDLGRIFRHISANNLSVDTLFVHLWMRMKLFLNDSISSKNNISPAIITKLFFAGSPEFSRIENVGCSEIISSIIRFEFWFILAEKPVSHLLDRHYTPLFIYHVSRFY